MDAALRPGLRLVLVALTGLSFLSSAAQARQIASRDGLSASVSDEREWCQDTVALAVRAPGREPFTGDRVSLQRLVAQVRFSLEEECPAAHTLRIMGYAGTEKVFEGIAARASGWAVAEVQTQAPPPVTVAGVPAPPAQRPGTVAEAMVVMAQTPEAPPAMPPSAPQMSEAARSAIRQCDALAAHPDDPEAFAKGVPESTLNAARAIAACSEAVRHDKTSPRLLFQLARAYLKAGRVEDALDQLIAAAEQEHGGALAYLADVVLDGAPGIEADPAMARGLYERAVASGFEPARKVLAGFEDMTDAYAKAEAEEVEAASAAPRAGGLKPYLYPAIMDNIQARKFDAIPWSERWVKWYLVNVADNIRAICEAHFTSNDIAALREALDVDHYGIADAVSGISMQEGLAAVFGKSSNPYLNGATRNLAAFEEADEAPQPTGANDSFEAGMADTEALFQRHMCKSPGLERLSKNLVAYVRNEEAPLPAKDAIFKACVADPLPSSKINDPRDVCGCFAMSLRIASVSQVHRKNLTKSFKVTALEIMSLERNVRRFRGCH